MTVLVLKIAEVQASQNVYLCFCRTYFGKLDFPGKKTIPLDSIVCLSNNMIGKFDSLFL